MIRGQVPLRVFLEKLLGAPKTRLAVREIIAKSTDLTPFTVVTVPQTSRFTMPIFIADVSDSLVCEEQSSL
jgi:hypothetical protein